MIGHPGTADMPVSALLGADCEAFIRQIAQLEHSQDDGADPEQETEEQAATLNGLIAEARELTRGWKPVQAAPFEEMVEGDDGWSEWRRPLPGYLMKCCDCSLVHEMEFAVVRQGKSLADGYFESEDVGDPTVFVMFRARRAGVPKGQDGQLRDEPE